jgi:hypothetical protein
VIGRHGQRSSDAVRRRHSLQVSGVYSARVCVSANRMNSVSRLSTTTLSTKNFHQFSKSSCGTEEFSMCGNVLACAGTPDSRFRASDVVKNYFLLNFVFVFLSVH